MLKSEGLVGLVNLESEQRLGSMPSLARRGLMKALVLVGSACEDQSSRDQYWDRVLAPLAHRFNSLLRRPDLKKIYNDDKVRGGVEVLLESLIGVAQGTHVNTASQLFAFLQPVLASLVDLLGLYHNYATTVELILEVFCETTKRTLCYLSQADSRMLYQRSVDAIQMYADHNKGRKSIEKEAEEEQFRDLLLLMELLMNLLTKDFIDLAPQGKCSR